MFPLNNYIGWIVMLIIVCGLIIWIISVRKGMYMRLDSLFEAQAIRLKQFEQILAQHQQQLLQPPPEVFHPMMFQSMMQPQPSVSIPEPRPSKPIVRMNSNIRLKPDIPPKPISLSPSAPPSSPAVVEEKKESEEDLDELLKEELAELAELTELAELADSTDLVAELSDEIEELSTSDGLKKTTE